MQQKKLSVNIFCSILVQIANFIAPLITAPYVARVLNAELIGQYSFTLANSSYFALLECLGFGLYGSIKVAAIRDNHNDLRNTFWEILYIKIALMFFSIVVYAEIFLMHGNSDLRTLYIIMLINIVANGLDITWFLSGLEEFKILAVRNIIIKVVNVIAILIFVKDENDLNIYALIMQAFTFLGFISVYPCVKKYILKPISLGELNLKQHIIPSMVYFVPGLINTIFSSTDKSILGVYTNKQAVGVYEQANKICQLCMGMISAVSNVILPRATYLYNNQKDTDSINKLLKDSIRAVLLICIPMVFGIISIADNFIPVFFGKGYEDSIILVRILAFNVLFVSLSNFVGQQALIARNKQKEYNISISSAAVLNLILNLIMVRAWNGVGVAVASAITSVIGFAIIEFYGKDVISLKEIFKTGISYAILAFVMSAIIYGIHMHSQSFTLIIQIVIAIIIYVLGLVIVKDPIYISLKNKLRKRV